MQTVIIGGGASGTVCAIRIKQNNPDASVTVLEHLDEPCKKIHATGNGRCNITNRSADGFENTRAFFESLGLLLRESGEGRMYPYSNQAASVVTVLLSACEKLGVKIVTGCTVRKAEKLGGQFNVFTDKGVFTADNLVIATGGKAQPSLGSDGSGYDLVRSFGHSVTALSPALVQLKSSSKNCRSLKGVRAKCRVKLEINGEVTAEDYGELLFTEYGISGIVTMNLSEKVSDEKLKNGSERCVAVIDFVPDLSEKDLLEHFEKFGDFEGVLPHKLCNILQRQTDGDGEKTAKYIKNWRLIITGTKGYEYAQITKGGVPLSELKEGGESGVCSNLYILGELTDNQFCCGGFNLDYAFNSGIKAADKIARA
ncbi:MAG: aminoacetone oxidase family FAD-binding enzyme [Ruminococcaceae bacterium]|nr:aminoacetone oxidase family FAD-binding enzyme [Oscillospiraceae bacterium]